VYHMSRRRITDTVTNQGGAESAEATDHRKEPT
jgi:hypothetical protein